MLIFLTVDIRKAVQKLIGVVRPPRRPYRQAAQLK